MRTFCLASMFFVGFVYSQQASVYFQPNKENYTYPHQYILKDDEESLDILRMNDHNFEWVSFPKNDEMLCSKHYQSNFYIRKKKIIFFTPGKQELIIHSDSLTFAVESEIADELNEKMSTLYFRNNKFYKKRLHALFN